MALLSGFGFRLIAATRSGFSDKQVRAQITRNHQGCIVDFEVKCPHGVSLRAYGRVLTSVSGVCKRRTTADNGSGVTTLIEER